MTQTTQHMQDDAQSYAEGISRLSAVRYETADAVEYYDDGMACWYVAPRADVIRLGMMDRVDAYSWWCTDTSHDMAAQ
jgi:hypothetical protein